MPSVFLYYAGSYYMPCSGILCGYVPLLSFPSHGDWGFGVNIRA